MKPVQYVERSLTCDGVALADVAAKVGTPAYVYSAPSILCFELNKGACLVPVGEDATDRSSTARIGNKSISPLEAEICESLAMLLHSPLRQYPMNINADYRQRVVLNHHDLPWVPSPESGVERPVDHPLGVHLQDARRREPAHQRLPDLGRVRPGARGDHGPARRPRRRALDPAGAIAPDPAIHRPR